MRYASVRFLLLGVGIFTAAGGMTSATAFADSQEVIKITRRDTNLYEIEGRIGVEDGRVVLDPVILRKKPTLKELLAQCDFSIPYTPEEQAERDLWDNLTPVGREFGSPEWNAAEAAGKLDAFLSGAWSPPSKGKARKSK